MFYEYFSRQLHDISFSVQHSFSGSLMVPESWIFGCARGRVREYLFSKSTHACRIYTFFKITQAPNPPRQKSSSATPWFSCFMFVNKKNSRKGQRTNQKYRNLVGSYQQMQRFEKTELRKADCTVGVNCYILKT